MECPKMKYGVPGATCWETSRRSICASSIMASAPPSGIDHAATLGRAGRIAVTDVVVAGHEIARVGEEAGEVVVAVDVLGHAVDELHDAARLEAAELGLAGGRIRALHGQGHPEDGADLAFPVGGIEGELGATGGRGGTGDRPANAAAASSFRLMANILSDLPG